MLQHLEYIVTLTRPDFLSDTKRPSHGLFPIEENLIY